MPGNITEEMRKKNQTESLLLPAASRCHNEGN